MQLLTIIYDSGIDERLTAAVEAGGATGWTRFCDGQGFGGLGHKVNTPAWPGTVNRLEVALDSETEERVVQGVRELQRSYRRNPGVTMWTQQIELR